MALTPIILEIYLSDPRLPTRTPTRALSLISIPMKTKRTDAEEYHYNFSPGDRRAKRVWDSVYVHRQFTRVENEQRYQ